MTDDRLKALYEQYKEARLATEFAREELRQHVLSQPEHGHMQEIAAFMHAHKSESLSHTVQTLEADEFRAKAAHAAEQQRIQQAERQQPGIRAEQPRNAETVPQNANDANWWRQDNRSAEQYAEDQARAAALAADLDDTLGPKPDPGSGRR